MAGSTRSRRTSSGGLTVLLLVVLVPPAAALVWLGFELLAQDRTLLRQRQADRREAAAESMARSLAQELSRTERSLLHGAGPEGVARVRFNGTSIEVEPRSALAWIPATPPLLEYASEPFARAEQDEYQHRGERARRTYVQASTAPDAALRAGALVRLGRLARRQGDLDAALAAYRRLSRITDIAVNGMPAELVARRMICDLLRAGTASSAFTREVDALASDFTGNKWLLDRVAWELTARDLAQWAGRTTMSADRLTLSAAMDALFSSASGPLGSVSGRRVVAAEGQMVTFAWRRDGASVAVLAIPSSRLAGWIDALASREGHGGLRFAALTDDGKFVAGSEPPDGRPAHVLAARRSAADTGLPWTLSVSGDAAGAAAELTTRRRLLAGGLAALVLLLCGGSYLVLRVVRREMAVARLQTDFVAAVSHEFRTPLTSLRHVTELLLESDDIPPPRRQAFYAVLAQNGDRLQRLVESVLDFARMEEGRRPWELRPVDLGAAVTQVVAEFERTLEDRRVSLLVASPRLPAVLAEPASLGHALWNLLDNAVKYSPDGGDVAVRLDASPSGVSVAVTDRGLGIPAGDRGAIFGRFVRGAAATRLGISGTGLGLALVAHIVDAHGGRVDVESEEGQGSTFTIHLPAADAADINQALAPTSPLHAEDSHR